MNMTTNISGAIRTAVLSILLCCVVYTLVIWAIAQLFVPNTANGSLVKNEAGEYVGSRQVAQEFTQDKYFHSRPSAADYNGAGAVGSNLTPTSPKITERAREIIKKYGATAGNPIPADLVTASGSGLDPHITLAAAKFQAPRVAKARGISEAELEKIIASQVEYPGGVMRNEPIVNVLMLNLALDRKR
ncbi:potassium-transporting ATPase subunit KdpC [Victivallis vadensis]|nr:potassium-transporting ATPase subunit KdpC [Victivallis vadensis]HJH04128.1 potassium-transporting ATPase subunit KdpC [Victivallis vadensis]